MPRPQNPDKKMITNNVIRLLDSKKISYTLFELPEEKLGAEETARFMGVPVNQVFKTIVITRPKGKPLLCVISGDTNVDLKNVAKLSDEKKVTLPTQIEAEKLTGLQTGGISPLALIDRGFIIILDTAALNFETVHISGGQRGLIIQIRVDDLRMLTKAMIGPISHSKP
jgi:Cys-tRNA(Pro)/Cys-tRNA(Cys) deacylase